MYPHHYIINTLEKNKIKYLILAFDMCCVRMMVAITNEYRSVKVHRKKKFNQDNVGKNNSLIKFDRILIF